MPSHAPNTKIQLRALVQNLLARDGPACSLNHIDVSNITDFSYTFMNLTFHGDASSWRMSQARNVRHMFEKASLATDLSMWDTSNVEDFSAMFEGACGRVGDIGLWNTRSAQSMAAMFANSSLRADLRHWDVAHVRNFARMFQGYKSLAHLAHWDTSSATLMSAMFEGADMQEDLARWDVSNVLSFHGMFAHSAFNGDISKWCVRRGQNFGQLFERSSFAGDISGWVFGDTLSSVAFDDAMDKSSLAATPTCTIHWYWAWGASPIERDRWLNQEQGQFFLRHAPMLEALDTPRIGAAKALQLLWLERDQAKPAPDSLALPAFDELC